MRENGIATPAAMAGNHAHLRELEWMIGEWIDTGDESTIETTCKWTKNGNFLTRSFKVVAEGHIDLEGTQVIGWDPISGSIRSWVFDSDGGFGEGSWRRNGNRWEIDSTQTLADGSIATSMNIFRYVDDHTFTWRSIAREINGEAVADISEVKVARKPQN